MLQYNCREFNYLRGFCEFQSRFFLRGRNVNSHSAAFSNGEAPVRN